MTMLLKDLVRRKHKFPRIGRVKLSSTIGSPVPPQYGASHTLPDLDKRPGKMNKKMEENRTIHGVVWLSWALLFRWLLEQRRPV